MAANRNLDPAEVKRRLLAGERTGVLATDLGVGSSTISYWRTKFGLARTFCPRKIDHDRVRELHAKGLSDTDVAKEVGIKPRRLGRIRRKMGLPAHGFASISFITKQRAHGLRRKAELVAATGLRSLHSLDGERYRSKSRAFAASYGLPTNTPRVSVTIVVALSSGPKTAMELAKALDRPSRNESGYHRFNCSRRDLVGAKNYLTGLVRGGLIAPVSRLPAPPLYTLTPLAMEMLASAPTTPAEESRP